MDEVVTEDAHDPMTHLLRERHEGCGPKLRPVLIRIIPDVSAYSIFSIPVPQFAGVQIVQDVEEVRLHGLEMSDVIDERAPIGVDEEGRLWEEMGHGEPCVVGDDRWGEGTEFIEGWECVDRGCAEVRVKGHRILK